ncbi:mesoderm induction early response protein [Rhynchospora pubera]|uniref:Mesoderm induction early response protein n=1 Tax=Rhynchospora pubera TaxID=906938 RepID=A0AAV8CXI0_9POAL|nr:mesoderm induction early response protein [Rhynchospora pubera]
MADDEKQTEVTRSGADWEVVSLTSSAYAAEPNKTEIVSDSSKTNLNQESSLFDSGHYVFPPNEHENLPIDQNLDESESKQREPEISLDKYEGAEEREEEEGKNEEELGTAYQDEFIEDEFQKSSSEIENRETGLESGPEKKTEGDDGEDGLEWVKKKGLWIYRHVKEANAVWSVVVAAALVGLVVLGQRWQREKSQHQYQLK